MLIRRRSPQIVPGAPDPPETRLMNWTGDRIRKQSSPAVGLLLFNRLTALAAWP